MTPKRIFLDWNRPVAELVAERLLAEAASPAGVPPDFQGLLVIVPTRQAGRRLREALAAACPQGVLAPRVATPELLAAPSSEAASETLCQLVMASVVGSLPQDGFSSLFPERPASDWRWRLGAAARLLLLRRNLSEGGLTLSGAAKLLEASPEPERWRQLAQLERLYLDAMAQSGLRDRTSLQLAKAAQPELPQGVKRIVLAGVPDPIQISLGVLERLAERVPVESWVHAPESEAQGFDAWGRPVPAYWKKAPIDISEERLLLELRPEAQAGRAAALAEALLPPGGKSSPESYFAIGLLDPDISSHLESALSRRGIKAFDPAGRPLMNHPLAQLALGLSELAEGGSFDSFARLLRLPDLLAYAGASFSATALLSDLDSLQNARIPASFEELLQCARDAANPQEGTPVCRLENPSALFSACQAVAQLVEPLKDSSWPRRLPESIAKIYGRKTLSQNKPEDKLFAAAADSIMGVLSELDKAASLPLGLPAKALRALFSRRLSDELLSVEPDHEGVSFDGWLELPWNAAPHLLALGFNEERVSVGAVRDAFLPDGAKKLLGLPDSERRFGRDAYLFRALLESRRGNGSFVATLGKLASDGSVLKPSRLLFRCPEDKLPQRALRLFGTPKSAPENAVSCEPSWKLAPPLLKPHPRVSVTAFASYLACPFRYYLKYVLGMSALDDRKLELEPVDFGTAIHAALESLARSSELPPSAPAELMAGFLEREASSWFERRFGSNPAAALLVQRDAAVQRLRHAARVLAEEYAKGWRVLPDFAERRLERDIIAGFSVHGRPDRVERNESTGEYRVLDFKTFEQGDSPEAKHFGPLHDASPSYARVKALNGRGQLVERAWRDLQLPLYIWLLRDALGHDAKISCAYFLLPKAVLSTRVESFESLTPDQQRSAEECARGVASDILASRFWPPSESVRYDDFESLCPAGEWASRFENVFPSCAEKKEGAE